MPEEKVYLTKEKFEELKGELEHLKTTRRKEVAEKLEYAKSLGDISENSEYQEAREAQDTLEERISTVESLFKSAAIVSVRKGDMIDIGSRVTVRKVDSKEERTYELVGYEEADMLKQKISNNSPLGEAMMGKKKGDVFTCKTPKGEVEYKVLKVE